MPPPIVVRSYKGTDQVKAAAVFQSDAASISFDGYRPVAQTWSSPGSGLRGALVTIGVVGILVGLFLYAPVLLVGVVIGIAGLITPRSPGSLTVTYQRPDRPEPVAPDHLTALEQLTSMRDRGLITPGDFEAKKVDLLARL